MKMISPFVFSVCQSICFHYLEYKYTGFAGPDQVITLPTDGVSLDESPQAIRLGK
ncbi:MAG: hypothetical protein ACXWCG_01505 [Flavitalea sp.]